jgi:predicted glycosyltransferase
VAEQERVDAYLATVERFEPDIAMTDSGAYGTSIAVSLKRIADYLETTNMHLSNISELLLRTIQR